MMGKDEKIGENETIGEDAGGDNWQAAQHWVPLPWGRVQRPELPWLCPCRRPP